MDFEAASFADISLDEKFRLCSDLLTADDLRHGLTIFFFVPALWKATKKANDKAPVKASENHACPHGTVTPFFCFRYHYGDFWHWKQGSPGELARRES